MMSPADGNVELSVVDGVSLSSPSADAVEVRRGPLRLRLKRLDSPMFDCRKRSKLLGGGGRDKLFGGEGRDKLYGGPGKDKAHGGEGRDLCRAERRKACERR